MNPCYRTLLTGVVLLLTGSPVAFAGTIEAINHTKWAITHFSVNGQSGLDAIGPFQGEAADAVTAHRRPGNPA